MAAKWWSASKDQIRSNVSICNLADMYEVASVTMFIDGALEQCKPLRRNSCGASGNLDFGAVTASWVAIDGRPVLLEESIDSSVRGALYSWDWGMGMVTYDGNAVAVEFCSMEAELYEKMVTAVSGALY